MLTWFQGGGPGAGTDYIYNDRYQQIADAIRTANLTSIGGPADQKVLDGIVQEIDISTGKVLFQWNSADHVPYCAYRAYRLPWHPAS